MNINALLMDERDNVVTCVAAVSKGNQIVYQKGGQVCTLIAEDDIPYCHKAALEDLPQAFYSLTARREFTVIDKLLERFEQTVGRGEM